MPTSELQADVRESSPSGDQSAFLRPSNRRLLSYFLVMFLSFLALYSLPFFIVRLPSFERWGGSEYGPALDFGYHTDGMNADVVIFGDSTSLNGIAPRQVGSELGLKVINLPDTITSLSTYDDLVLRRYLEHNRPPRLIVFYLIPWNFDYRRSPSKAIFEGEEMLFRYSSPAQIWDINRHHIASTLKFPLEFLATVPHTAAGAALRHEDRVAQVANSLGHLDVQGFRERLAPECTIKEEFATQKGIATMQDLVAKYRTPQTQTMAFAAPIPACSNIAQVLAYPYASVPSAPPRVISPHLVMSDNFYAHISPEAVPAASSALTDAIRPLLSSPGDKP